MYDLIVIGGGVSGFAAAMYAARLGLKTLVLTGDLVGGLITFTNVVENYPGFRQVTGQELADRVREHAESYSDYVEVRKEKALKAEKTAAGFRISAEGGVCETPALILAAGTAHRELNVAGHAGFLNKGVHYCALCDAFAYKDKVVGVVGGSDSAVKEALVLAGVAKKVYILYRKEKIRAEPINLKRLEALGDKIEIINNADVVEIRGKKNVERVVLDREYNGSRELRLDGLFVAIGQEPQSELARQLGVALNEKGEIIINRESATNVAGVWAAGDVTDTKFKQAVTGVAQGVTAAFYAYEYLQAKRK